jgi:hypothetical protein
MRLCCALVLLGMCGALRGQVRAQTFEVGAALGELEEGVGAVPGNVQPVDRFVRLLTQVLKREAKAGAGQPNVAQVVVRRARQQMLLVQGEKELCDLVQSVLDELRREPLPRLHLTCTVLVMPWEVAAAHGLTTNDVQEADMASMAKLMRDVVKVKGTLRNLPETIATPLVPFVAEPGAGGDGKPPPPKGAENVHLRGEAVAVSSEEALVGVQLVRGNLPEDRTQLPKGSVFDRAFRLRVGAGVTMTAKSGKTATVLWLRFTGTSAGVRKARVV